MQSRPKEASIRFLFLSNWMFGSFSARQILLSR
jgi:hypothetical protein